MAAEFPQPRQILETLRQGFIAQIPVRLAAIEQGWIDCHMGSDPSGALHELARLAHSLRGTAKTYGLMALGDAAGRLEAALKPWLARGMAPEGEARTQLDGLVAALGAAAREESGPLPETVARASKALPLIYLFEDDRDQAASLSTQLAHFGYQVSTFDTPQALLAGVARTQPDCCVLDIVMAGHDSAGIELGHQLHQRDATLPVIFTSVRDDIEARLRAVQAGGVAYLSKPLDVGLLVDVLDQMTGRGEASVYRILVVEDDESLARYYRALLRDAGMEAMDVTQPLEVLQALADFGPDLVLMDIYMPQCSGAELAQVIRQHGGHAGLPIVFLSAEDDPDIQFSALRTGGDDFLTKPVDPGVLVRTITLRAQRARQLNAQMVRDGLTGLLNHGRIKEMLLAEVARARRSNEPLAVAMLDLDHFKAINDQHGHMAGDRVLKSLSRLLRERLRSSDLAGRYGGEEFLLILPDCDLVSARQLVEDVRTRFGQIIQSGDGAGADFKASFSAGLAMFPSQDGADALLLAADAALYEAKRQGRNRTC